jgi:hypothetical protein
MDLACACTLSLPIAARVLDLLLVLITSATAQSAMASGSEAV